MKSNFKIVGCMVVMTMFVALACTKEKEKENEPEVWAPDEDIIWKHNFGGNSYDWFKSITAVSGGFVASGGSVRNSFGSGDWAGITGNDDDAIIVKYSANGNVVWKKRFGSDYGDDFLSVTAVSDGVVAAGYSVLDGGDWAGVTKIGSAIIVQYGNDGNIVWMKSFGGGGERFSSITAISGGLVAAGNSAATSFGKGDWAGISGKGKTDAIIVKFDDNGNVMWKKNFGGADNDEFYSVTAVSDGIVAVGGSENGSSGDWEGIQQNGREDAIIVKFDNNGSVMWKKRFGCAGNDRFYSVIAASDGVVAAGYSVDLNTGDWAGVAGKGGQDAILVKFDNAGNVVWKKHLGGSGGEVYHSVTTVSGGFVAAGSSYTIDGSGDLAGLNGIRGALLVGYDNNGNVLWKKRFGVPNDVFYSVTATSGIIVAAGESQDISTIDWEGFVGKGRTDAMVVAYQK